MNHTRWRSCRCCRSSRAGGRSTSAAGAIADARTAEHEAAYSSRRVKGEVCATVDAAAGYLTIAIRASNGCGQESSDTPSVPKTVRACWNQSNISLNLVGLIRNTISQSHDLTLCCHQIWDSWEHKRHENWCWSCGRHRESGEIALPRYRLQWFDSMLLWAANALIK